MIFFGTPLFDLLVLPLCSSSSSMPNLLLVAFFTLLFLLLPTVLLPFI